MQIKHAKREFIWNMDCLFGRVFFIPLLVAPHFLVVASAVYLPYIFFSFCFFFYFGCVAGAICVSAFVSSAYLSLHYFYDENVIFFFSFFGKRYE